MPGQIQPVKLGGNSLRLHCMPAWSNWYHLSEFDQHLSQWIYTQFDRLNLTGQSNSTGH